MLDQETIRIVQERANNIWPAESSYLIKGWILRINKGVTWRANSVLPLNYWGKNLLNDITKVEEIYRQYNFSSKFMLHDQHAPSDLYSTLIDLSYQPVMPTDVMGKKISEIKIEEIDHSYTYDYYLQRTPEWYSNLSRLSPRRSPYKMKVIGEIMDRVAIPRKKYFFSTLGSEMVGVVLAVIDDNFLGIMNLAVDPKHRNKGIATNLVSQTVEWGKSIGTEYIFLQVEKSNSSARNLYVKIGLEDWYTYTYYEKEFATE